MTLSWFFSIPPFLRGVDSALALQVKDDVRRTVVDTAMATESAKTFKRVMWCNRRPRLLRVLAEELVELDRCVFNAQREQR